MKTPNLIVRIPEPCHEDWNAMQPDAKGKFCNSCSKSVFDFSNKTDAEIKNILIEFKDQKVCGHFKKSQVDRPLNIKVNLKDLPKNISITKAFVIAVFLAFGTMLFSCTNESGTKIGDISFEENKEEQMLAGMVMPDYPLPIDSLAKSEVGDTIVEGQSSCESVMTGDMIIEEQFVDGGIEYQEITLEEVPVVTEQTTVVDEVIMGMMVMPYREKEVVEEETPTDSTNQESTERKIETKEIITKKTELSIYPNPATGEFTIKYDLLKRADVRVDIFDMKGVLIRTVVDVAQQYEGKYQIPVNLNELPNGTYIVSLINNDKKTTERLVIMR